MMMGSLSAYRQELSLDSVKSLSRAASGCFIYPEICTPFDMIGGLL